MRRWCVARRERERKGGGAWRGGKERDKEREEGRKNLRWWRWCVAEKEGADGGGDSIRVAGGKEERE